MGQEIINLYDKALNKDKYSFYQSSSTWNFVRCAVDQTRKKFYINDNIELDLEGEILYGSTKNYRPFRYFKISRKHYLKFQTARFNPTRIFIRQIKCYRDYIDFNLMDLKYIACGTSNDPSGRWYSPCLFYPLSFCFDYGEMVYPNWPNCDGTRRCFTCSGYSGCGLVYHMFEENNEISISPITTNWPTFLASDTDPYYPTSPNIYRPYFCDHGQAGGDKEECTGGVYYCRLRNSTALFWPDRDNYYLDLNTLEQLPACRNGCRPPDSYYRRNFCLMQYSVDNIINCASGYAIKDEYNNNFKCKPGYTKVYYECIETKLISKSALYFSNVYSFPNVVFSPADKSIEYLDYRDWKIETRLASYYVEVWIKLDSLNYRNKITENEYYLFAHPHIILKSSVDQRFKYSNKFLSNGYYLYPLNTMQIYEWNHIIIENLYDPDTKLFSIKVFLNTELDKPQVDIPDLISSIYKLHFRGFGFCNKIDDAYCKINNEVSYLKWGVAWYRNFRVWDADITTLQSIIAADNGYNQTLNSQKYYFTLTADSLDKNTIKDKLAPEKNKMVLNFWNFNSENDYQEALDNDIRINYSTDNFDKTYIYENYYSNGINEDGTDYTIFECPPECKRCYSSFESDCYECRLGYTLYDKKCKMITGYFFKSPPNNSTYEKIEITTKNDNTYFDIKKINPITITLYIKYFGIDLTRVKTGKIHYILACFYKDTSNNDKCMTYIGYNYNDKKICFVVNGNEIYAAKAKDYIGIWTHFGISIHKKEDENDPFPCMINFMIDQKVLAPIKTFNPMEKKVDINTFTIYTESVCYYSSFKVFSTFYLGPYGHINAKLSVRNSKLLYQVNLYGSSNLNCISNANLAEFPSVNLLNLNPICVPDYQPYEDQNNICKDDYHFVDVIYKISPPCELCDSQCITNCFSLESSACTCDYYEGLYWVKTDFDYQSYECQRVDSINFAFYDSVTIEGLDVVTNDEMTIAFWLDIYEYLDNKFESLEIIWNQHLAVIIKGNDEQGDNKFLNIECHGDYDIINPEMLHTVVNDNDRLKFGKWNYIICQADKFHHKIKVNNLKEEEYSPIIYLHKSYTSSLIIVDKTRKFNYGFSFVRELKLYSSYNFDFWDDSHYNIKKESFIFLLHHFHNDFNGIKLADAKIKDQVTGTVKLLTVKPQRIGYNYVVGYENLKICEEGYIYNNLTNTCILFNSKKCKVPRNNDDNCLSCFINQPYLNNNDLCVDDCRPYYFSDDYLKQCRKCHDDCYTCSGKYYNNCLSCTGDYYLIESQHICVLHCQEYGLISSLTISNKCEEESIETYISIPVYLNYSYDYNPLNEDYKAKIINRNTFHEIQGHVTPVLPSITTKWTYNWEESLEINKPYRFYHFNEIPNENPIISDPSNLRISLNNSYFKNGYKYIFDLEIISTSGNFNITRLHKYIIMMNDYPVLDDINISPNRGYISNKFLMIINNCRDDISDKSELNYKFTCFTKMEEVKSGFNETSNEEKLIHDWSKYSEAVFQFNELNPIEGNKFYIRAYCKDEHGLYYSIIKEIEVYDVPTKSKIDIPLEESIDSFDIDKELTIDQLLNRAKILASLTSDFEKEVEILNRTNITDFNKKGLWQQNLILFEPTSSKRDLYCNYRGDSYVEYFYLICDCKGYAGNMCQIDYNSYEFIKDTYNKMLYKIKIMQSRKYNKDLVNSLELLISSAATFMEVDNINYFLDSLDIINSHMNTFSNEMLTYKNYETYFNLYNSFIEYGISIVNQLKYKNFKTYNKKNTENIYNIENIRKANLTLEDSEIIKNYFYKLKLGVQNLVDFYALNQKEFRFINKNINLYSIPINEDFPFDTYFNIENKLYEPYVEFKRCLEKNLNHNINDLSFRYYLSIIVWKTSPFMYDEELYFNTLGPAVTLKFINSDTGEKIFLTNCENDDNQIKLYFPVKNYNFVKIINEKRDILSPVNQFGINDDIFYDPIYINKSGAVINSSPGERREKYFLGFNFSCKYYSSSSEDRTKIKLETDNLEYSDYTKQNYIQCLLNKLHQDTYNEFVVDFYNISSDFHLNSRLFYLKHFQLLSWKDNYSENYAFYYHLIIIIIYLSLTIVYFYIEKYNYTKMQTVAQLKREITKMNLPYRDEYVFDSDLILTHDIKDRLKGKRKPNMEEMNLDINNLDINIMADEITKYNKNLKNQDIINNKNVNSNFFNTKEPKNKDIIPNFFRKENELPPNINIDNEISPEKIAKMKKFYQVGFKGLDSKENIKKEISLSSDKKRIVVNKKDNLDKIDEINEEEEIEIGDKGLNFFDKESEEDSQEKKTGLKKIINKKKFGKNINKYQDFISSNEDIDSKSKLRDSDRETATKKFFSPNPPKKERNLSINNSSQFNFTDKDQKKIGKSNSIFFSGGSEGLTKNKRKEKNIFQKDYENTYNPQFKGPKILSENLGFYNYETDFFEQNNDNDNKNPPYFGDKIRKINKDEISNKKEDLDLKKNRIGFYYKSSQIDLKENEKNLPKLNDNLTFEQKMQEFHDIGISFKGFLFRNIASRYILLTTFSKMNIAYQRFMRAGNFAAQLSMFAFFLSLFFAYDEKMEIYEKKDKGLIMKFILYCF